MANRFKLPITASIDTGQLSALIQRIQGLDKKAGRGAIRKGLDQVTKAVLKDAKAGVRKRSGMLRRALGRKVVTRKGGARIEGIVKPRGGTVWVSKPPNFVVQYETRTLKSGRVQHKVPRRDLTFQGKAINPVRYAHLVEFGRVSVTLKKKKVLSDGSVIFGKTVRGVAARPFMRPAWAKNEPNAVPALRRQLFLAISNYWSKESAKVPRTKT